MRVRNKIFHLKWVSLKWNTATGGSCALSLSNELRFVRKPKQKTKKNKDKAVSEEVDQPFHVAPVFSVLPQFNRGKKWGKMQHGWGNPQPLRLYNHCGECVVGLLESNGTPQIWIRFETMVLVFPAKIQTLSYRNTLLFSCSGIRCLVLDQALWS